MGWFVDVDDDRGERLAAFACGHGFYVYVLRNGKEFDIETQVVWCRRCQRFTLAERIPTVEELDREYAELEALRNQPLRLGEGWDPAKALRCRYLTRTREDATVRRAMCLKRRSPPRCLKCGSTDFAVAGDWNVWLPHPAGTGNIRVSCGGIGDISGPKKAYTLEGLPISGLSKRERLRLRIRRLWSFNRAV